MVPGGVFCAWFPFSDDRHSAREKAATGSAWKPERKPGRKKRAKTTWTSKNLTGDGGADGDADGDHAGE